MNFDFYNLPDPQIVKVPNSSEILENLKTKILDLDPSLASNIHPAAPIHRLLETIAFREVYYKTMLNEQTKALFIRYAEGSTLDNLAAVYSIKRKIIQEEDKQNNKPQILESDSNFRKRIILSLNGLTNAGTPSAYRHHALTVDDSIKDASAVNQGSGRVLITLLSYAESGKVEQEIIAKAIKHLNSDDVKPLCDLINVISAKVNKYNLKVMFYFKTNVDAKAQLEQLHKLAEEFRAEKFYLGKNIYLSQLVKKLHLPSVEKLNILEPKMDLISKEEEAFLLDKVEFNYDFIE